MPQSCRLLAALTLLSIAIPSRAADAPPPNDKLNTKIASVTLHDAAGKAIVLNPPKDGKAVVVVFLSFECPVSNSYVPILAELAKRYEGKGVTFLAVNSSDDGDAAQLARQAAEYKLPFPMAKDKDRAAVDALKARVVSETFVLDHNGVLRYRGRIDDGYTKRLVRSVRVTSHDLQNALDDLLAGKSVRVPATTAVGCPIPQAKGSATTGKVTYHRDVLPILQSRCQDCHRPGEVGPFSLLTYKQAVTWASDIKEYTSNHQMPPWKPVEGVAFHNDRRMTEKEIATLAAWVDGDTPEGDPKDAPKPRVFGDGWKLGKPDLILTVPEEMTVGASGRDLFRVFVLPTDLPEDKVVKAVEVRPSNNRVVHHTLNFWDTSGQARQKEKAEKERKKAGDEQDHGPGYSSSMGIGIRPTFGKFGGLGGWAPGNLMRPLPEGAGWSLPKGADVMVQVHYHRTGRVEKDRVSIGLYLSDKPTTTKWKDIVVPGRFLWIPANDEHYVIRDGVEVLQDCVVHTVMPHMHMLGKEIKVTVTPPAGKTFTLVAIKDWNYNWQETYALKVPLAMKAGTKIVVEAVYDNSARNPNNPNNPPGVVTIGEQTDNEMCFVFLGATSEKPGRMPFRLLDRAAMPKKD